MFCRFMCSADEFITIAHVPSRMMAENGKTQEIDHEEQMVKIMHILYTVTVIKI